jgi:hypothetical protein
MFFNSSCITAKPDQARGFLLLAAGCIAFNGNSNLGIASNKNFAVIGSADMIAHC